MVTVYDDPAFSELLDHIDHVRQHRSAFVAEIKAGGVSLAEVFDRAKNDPVLASMKVLPAIEGLPEAGKVQTRRAFEELGIEESAHLGDVANDAIAALPAAIERHAL